MTAAVANARGKAPPELGSSPWPRLTGEVCLSLLAPPGSRRKPARRVVPADAGAWPRRETGRQPWMPLRAWSTSGRVTLAHRVRAYVALTKPRIIELLLVTTVPAMVLAARGFPGGWLLVATLVGGSLAAGSANTINCYVDRDIDQVMHRTRSRPLVRAPGGAALGADLRPRARRARDARARVHHQLAVGAAGRSGRSRSTSSSTRSASSAAPRPTS